MPTVVSSKQATIKMETVTSTDSQQAIYDGKKGRYITFVSGLYIEGDPNKGIKGLDMPTENITFNSALTTTGNGSLITNSEWARLYSTNPVDDIEAVILSAPYSTTDSNKNQKQTKVPGEINVDLTDNTFITTISDYSAAFNFPTLNSDDTAINNKYYIGTYAFTAFSPRTTEDGKNDITVNYSASSIYAKGTNGEIYSVDNSSAVATNSYYQSTDNSYDSGLFTTDNIRLSSQNTIGSLSKGTEVIYKTSFDYQKTVSDEGLKEVIKVNPNAFRVLNYDDKNSVDIKVTCGDSDCSNISKDDFEIKFVSGNYSNTNYFVSDLDQRVSEEDKAAFTAACSGLDISTLNNDQILNIYGSPCITANSGVEASFDKINDFVDSNNEEIPITKVIVQTKNGVTLPDSANIEVSTRLRVRNVADITRVYQVASVVSTSDYDNELHYFYPTEANIINPDNYTLPVISGNEVVGVVDVSYADSARIASYTSDQEITVLNRTSDNKMKTVYNTKDNETIIYRIKPIITDNNEKVGADDTWFVKYVRLEVRLPKELSYVADKTLDKFLVGAYPLSNETLLEYILPYTKPNAENSYVEFKSVLSSMIKDSGVPVTVRSYIQALNVNKEVDNALFGKSYKDLTIYANGETKVILEQKVGNAGSIVEKNAEFSYLLSVYNNTNSQVDNYTIMDIIPYTKDGRDSNVSGTVEAKLVVPSSLGTAKIYCSTQNSNTLKSDIDDSNNTWVECPELTEGFKEITAFKITNISVPQDSYTEAIELIIKPTNNNYSDKYVNNFIGGSEVLDKTTSNKVGVSVVSRIISGKVFSDNNENGIQDEGDSYVANVPVTLYKIDGETETKISETTTNNEGKYEFKNLDVGRYYVNLGYDGSKYDLTLRYASVDERVDSDAYKVSDTVARISNKRVPNDPYGILVTREDVSLENYDMGLVPRYSFGFDIKKYITKIDLSYRGNVTTKNYNNLSKVVLDVRKSELSTAKVYYGIAITNNSVRPGYVSQLEESIPEGLIFDETEPENKDWVLVNGKAYSTSLADTLIKPGETKYLQVVLYMPSRETATTFINTVSIIDMVEYQDNSVSDKEYVNENEYQIGESVSYAGFDWHVINTELEADGNQKVTLLADSGSIPQKMAHTHASSSIYKWGESNINGYLNNVYNTSLDYGVLYPVAVCNDASGLQVASHGGNISGVCQSYDFVDSRVRLLSSEEYLTLTTSSLSNIDWLTGNEDYWLASSNDTTYSKASYVSSTGIKSDNANALKEVRPVITISSRNILFE